MLSSVGVVALACLLGASAAAAAAPPGASFSLVPQHYDPALAATQSYFVAVVHPGETFTNNIRVRNVGSHAGTALLYAVDATTGKTSGAVYLDDTKPRRGVGAWVTIGARSVTLGPGESKVVPITVHVPAGASPGDHLGGIVAENAALTGANGRGALQIKLRHLTIAAVEVQIPGKTAAALRIGGAKAGGEHGYQYVYVRLANTGSLTTKPRGHLAIVDASGERVDTRNFELDTFLPGTAIDYPVLLPGKALEPGEYRANVGVTYGAAPIGYRRMPGRMKTISRSLLFTITDGQYSTVFNGVKPVTAKAHAGETSSSSGSLPSSLVVVAAVGAVLLAGIAAALMLLRRRA